VGVFIVTLITIFGMVNSELLGDEQFCSNSIFGFEVNIHASQKSSLPALSTGSSKVMILLDDSTMNYNVYHFKVKITTITNQSWDLTNRYGYLVASSNDYLAYVLEGMVTMAIILTCITAHSFSL